MGDRAQIQVTEGQDRGSVYLYTHWGAYRVMSDLKSALSRNERWDDAPYLARIIFDAMKGDDIDGETGYGLWGGSQDGSLIKVDCRKQTVTDWHNNDYTFEEFIAKPWERE